MYHVTISLCVKEHDACLGVGIPFIFSYVWLFLATQCTIAFSIYRGRTYHYSVKFWSVILCFCP